MPRPSATRTAETQTPRSLGYRMPAEWERHAATWLAWPHDPVTWADRLPRVEEVYRQMVEALAPHERVELLVRDEKEEARVLSFLSPGARTNVRSHLVRTVDAWIRDYGPIFVRRTVNGRFETAYCDWRFNAWGNKYEALKADDDVPRRLAPVIQRPLFQVDVVLEGGSIEVNGAGLLLTTEQCLLNPNRNPNLGRAALEALVGDFLGVEKVLWLRDGIEGDDTDGHIDDVARFVDAQTVVCAVEEDRRDANFNVLRDNFERVSRMTDVNGRPLRVIPLPMPGRLDAANGRLPASYANFYIANGVVLMPSFGHANDERARRILAQVFPTRRVVPVDCSDLVWGFGALHCVTQQQPAESG